MSGYDAEEARWSGVSPSASFSFVRALCCSRSSTTPTSPASDAICSGVCRVPPSAVSGFALNSSNSLHASTCGGQRAVRCSRVKHLEASPLCFSAPVRNFSTYQYLHVQGYCAGVRAASEPSRATHSVHQVRQVGSHPGSHALCCTLAPQREACLAVVHGGVEWKPPARATVVNGGTSLQHALQERDVPPPRSCVNCHHHHGDSTDTVQPLSVTKVNLDAKLTGFV